MTAVPQDSAKLYFVPNSDCKSGQIAHISEGRALVPAMPALLIRTSTEECNSPIFLPLACIWCAQRHRDHHEKLVIQMRILSRSVLARLCLFLKDNIPQQRRHLQCPGLQGIRSVGVASVEPPALAMMMDYVQQQRLSLPAPEAVDAHQTE